MKRILTIAALIVLLLPAMPAAQEVVVLEFASAEAAPDDMTGLPVLKVLLTRDGQDDFADFTARHAGKRADLLVDGRLLTSPVIQTEIVSRWLMLSGNFTMEEVEGLAAHLNAAQAEVTVRSPSKLDSK